MSLQLSSNAPVAPEPPLLSDDERTAFLDYVDAHKKCTLHEAAVALIGPIGPEERLADYNRRWKGLRGRMRQLIAREPQFGEAYREARDMGQDELRQVWRDRAITGWMEPVYQGGEKVGEKWVFSERLLAMGLKAYLSEFREYPTVEVRGDGGGANLVEDRSARLREVYEVLVAAGQLQSVIEGTVRREHVGGAPPGAVPDARPVLAEPPVGEPAADSVPPPREP